MISNGRAYTRFMIMSDARTGSNLVQDALNAHPDVICFRELFNLDQEFIDYDVEGWDGHDPAALALRNEDPGRFLAHRIFAEHTGHVEAVGFKFHYHHFWFHADLLPALQADVGLRVIHLQRRNLLRSLVSARIAQQTGMWLQHDDVARKRRTLLQKLNTGNLKTLIAHPADSMSRMRRFLQPVNVAPAAAREAVTLTYEDCQRHFFRVRHEIQHFTGLLADHPVIVITYEDIIASPDESFTGIEQFLGVTPRPVSSTLKRQNPEPLHALITNYAALRESFAGAPEQSFFDD